MNGGKQIDHEASNSCLFICLQDIVLIRLRISFREFYDILGRINMLTELEIEHSRTQLKPNTPRQPGVMLVRTI